jgi:hypothetical protein
MLKEGGRFFNISQKTKFNKQYFLQSILVRCLRYQAILQSLLSGVVSGMLADSQRDS